MPATRDVATPIAGASSSADEPAADARRTLAFRRSLRRSRGRRDEVARRRRRALRGRCATAAAAAGLLLAAGGAIAQEAGSPAAVSSDTVAAAQRALSIAADGVVGPLTRRATRRFQREQGLAVDGVIGPATLQALGVGGGAGARSAAAGGVLERIAACESGGNPAAVSADGRYRGRYQFSRATWSEVGGTGDPAAAPAAEQDRRAGILLERQGPSAWPSCA